MVKPNPISASTSACANPPSGNPTVSGFQGRDRPSCQCPSRFAGR